MRVGLMGGTFDPIHNAHLHIAKTARRAMALDAVWFIPVGNPPHKRFHADARDRLRMAELAVESLPWAQALPIEAQRQGMTYTVDTLTQLRELHPEDELFYIVGTDALRDMPLWRDAARAMNLCELIAVTRPGFDENALTAAKEDARRKTGAVVHIVEDREGIELSSTQIREKVATGAPIDDLTPPPVAAYIRERGLYRSASAK